MRPRFQADENLNAKIIAGLCRREPSMDFQTAKAAGLLGLEDRQVLAVAAQDGRILVSHDCETMPAHFSRFIEGSPSAGLLIVSQKLGIREAVEQILLIRAASEAEEWINQIGYLPFRIRRPGKGTGVKAAGAPNQQFELQCAADAIVAVCGISPSRYF